MKNAILTALCIFAIIHSVISWQSSIVGYNAVSKKLSYVRDAEGNVIPDFSTSGYHSGERELPNVSQVKTLSWVEMTDHTNYIQNAINEVSILPISSNFRGALVLGPGRYIIKGSLYINASGVVLRGSGQGMNDNIDTILEAVDNTPDQRDVIIAGSGDNDRWRAQVKSTKTNILNDMDVGDKIITVQKQLFSVGDTVVITYPTTDAWLQSVQYGGTDPQWTVNDQISIQYHRIVTATTGNTITINAPVFNSLRKNLSQPTIYKHDNTNRINHIGVEDLRIVIKSNGGPSDENHAWNALSFTGAEHVFVRRCTMTGFGLAGVEFQTVTYATVDSVTAEKPVAQTTGGRMYNFCLSDAAQHILIKNSHARDGRHHYVSNGSARVSGMVVLNCTCSNINAASEGHRRWSTGILYDNLKSDYDNLAIGIYTRGTMGPSHGWSAANSVVWNSRVPRGSICVQKPPTAQNFGIGCHGVVSGNKQPCPFEAQQGFIEGSNVEGLEPSSLYLAQLVDRLNNQ
ncbi:hypothetical protein AKO1_005918 [Acrasis kona]|uniref:Uncharacterized protein n=1 Tax=Acrasis kona TaxID=1008807 RepID=A0AAW2YJI1_9EUKA